MPDRIQCTCTIVLSLSECLTALDTRPHASQTLNVKYLGARFDSWTSTFFRGVVGTALCLIDALFFKTSEHKILGKPENRRMLLLRGLLGGLTIASAFFAVQAMDLAEVRKCMCRCQANNRSG